MFVSQKLNQDLQVREAKNLISQFHVLAKCKNKFDCLVKEMLFIRRLVPDLNVQTDSIRAKVFV